MLGVDYDAVARVVAASRDYTMNNARYERFVRFWHLADVEDASVDIRFPG